MVFDRIKSIGELNNVKISDMCLVFKRNIDLSSESSVDTINFKNNFSNMSFTDFYRTELELKEYIKEKGENIRHDQVLNIPENSSIPFNGEISIRNFENSKQYDILECEFTSSSYSDCTNINFFNSVRSLENSKINKLNSNIDIIKYKILSSAEIISDTSGFGAIDVNFNDNIFTNLIIIDIYTDTLITGNHGASVSGANSSGLNGGDGSNGNNGSSAIIFKNVPSNGIKSYIYQNDNNIIGGFGSSGGNGGNGGKKAMSEAYVEEIEAVEHVQGKYYKDFDLDSVIIKLGTADFIKTGLWAKRNTGNEVYFGLFDDNYTQPVHHGWLVNSNGTKRTAINNEAIKSLFSGAYSGQEASVSIDDESVWTTMRLDNYGSEDWEYWTDLGEWKGNWSDTDAQGIVSLKGKATLYSYGSVKPADADGTTTTYVAGVAYRASNKGHEQQAANATDATSGTAAGARTNNARNHFKAVKGSTGTVPNNSNTNNNNISYNIMDAGANGTGGEPGTNAEEIEKNGIYAELITIQ